jgi:hypothetical protein
LLKMMMSQDKPRCRLLVFFLLSCSNIFGVVFLEFALRHLIRVHNQWMIVATPLLEECEDDTHTPEMGTWESSRTLETSELDCKGQNTSPWGVPHDIGKLLKCRCQKWPHINHLDICAQVMAKRRAGSQNGNLTPDH